MQQTILSALLKFVVQRTSQSRLPSDGAIPMHLKMHFIATKLFVPAAQEIRERCRRRGTFVFEITLARVDIVNINIVARQGYVHHGARLDKDRFPH